VLPRESAGLHRWFTLLASLLPFGLSVYLCLLQSNAIWYQFEEN